MSLADEKLTAIKTQLDKGVVPTKETVRSFLAWFNAERRGYNVVQRIRLTLKNHGLVTLPDFEVEYIDNRIGFAKAPSPTKALANESPSLTIDPTYRLRRLDSANKSPIKVAPDSTIKEAVTLMMTNDFSQLPVMTGPRDVKGVISWKSIGRRLALGLDCNFVRECMDSPETALIDDSIFKAIDVVAIHDYVIVVGADKTVCGIVTASDFNDQFRRLAEPFLLVGEVEHGIRGILHGKFTIKELEMAKAPGDDGRTIGSVSDLTVGEYVRLIESDEGWRKLRINIDRREFVSRLQKIRQIRNDVMHFDPDGLEPSDLTSLREFTGFLKMLRDIGAV